MGVTSLNYVVQPCSSLNGRDMDILKLEIKLQTNNRVKTDKQKKYSESNYRGPFNLLTDRTQRAG